MKAGSASGTLAFGTTNASPQPGQALAWPRMRNGALIRAWHLAQRKAIVMLIDGDLSSPSGSAAMPVLRVPLYPICLNDTIRLHESRMSVRLKHTHYVFFRRHRRELPGRPTSLMGF